MRVRPLARRLGSLALVAGLALGAASCSDDSSSGDAPSSADESAEETPADISEESEETTDEPAEGSTGSTEQAEAPEELTAEEFFPTVLTALQDAESFRFSSTTTTAGSTQEATGVGRFTEDGAELKASSTGAIDMEMIILGKALYLKSESLVPGGKWVKVDLRDSQNPLFAFLARAIDPQAMIEALESPEKLELLGAEEVEGVTANHYRITVDSAPYASAMGLPPEVASLLPAKIVQDMWLDSEHRPVKYAGNLKTRAFGGAKPLTTTTEGLYHEYGLDVDIEAPPASETTEAPALPGAA